MKISAFNNVPLDYKKTLFIVGAGVSLDFPSGIPPAWPVTQIFCRWIAGGDEDLFKTIQKRCKPQHNHNLFDFIRFESLIGAIDKIDPEIVNALSILEFNGLPNAHHFFLSVAAMNGARIITTNFDTRIESAAEWNDSSFDCFILSSRNRIPKDSSRLIKVHGSFPFNGKRRPAPKATFNRIGEIGLGFVRYPGFRKWFVEASKDATVYVLGYSASDSFDVVPLLEEYCKARRIEWFDFNAKAKRLSFKNIVRGDPSPLPLTPSNDLIGMTLSRIKGLRPTTEVIRVNSNSLKNYLTYCFGDQYTYEVRLLAGSLKSFQEEYRHATEQNLFQLDQALKDNPLTDEDRDLLIRILFDDGTFGEGFTRSEDEHNPDIPITIDKIAIQNSPSVQVSSLQEKFKKAIDAGEIAEGFKYAEEWFSSENDDFDPELGLMLADYEFTLSEEKNDTAGMVRARKKAHKISKQYGVIWGMVLVKRMAAMETYLCFKQDNNDVRFKPAVRKRSIDQALSFCYYSFRTGREDWFVPAIWLTGVLHENLFSSTEAILLHQRLLSWLPGDSFEYQGVTLGNLVSFHLINGNRRMARKFLKMMETIDFKAWPLREVFALIAHAEIQLNIKQFQKALLFLNRAETLIKKRFQKDEWSQLGKITRMRETIHKRFKTIPQEKQVATGV